jgi:hypothetical protein
LPEAFRKAFKLAQSEKLGPTHIEIPNFRTYLVASHRTHSCLGGNLCISNQRSYSEQEIGAERRRAALEEKSGKFEQPFISSG